MENNGLKMNHEEKVALFRKFETVSAKMNEIDKQMLEIGVPELNASKEIWKKFREINEAMKKVSEEYSDLWKMIHEDYWLEYSYYAWKVWNN